MLEFAVITLCGFMENSHLSVPWLPTTRVRIRVGVRDMVRLVLVFL